MLTEYLLLYRQDRRGQWSVAGHLFYGESNRGLRDHR